MQGLDHQRGAGNEGQSEEGQSEEWLALPSLTDPLADAILNWENTKDQAAKIKQAKEQVQRAENALQEAKTKLADLENSDNIGLTPPCDEGLSESVVLKELSKNPTDAGELWDEAQVKMKARFLKRVEEFGKQAIVEPNQLLKQFDEYLEKKLYGSHPLSYGDMAIYNQGLDELVGRPQKNFLKAIEWEHNSSPFAHICFTHANGQSLETSAAAEYHTAMQGGEFCAEGDQFDPELFKTPRRCQSLDALYKICRTNERLKAAGLDKEDILALSLYTGPMFKWYSLVLRACLMKAQGKEHELFVLPEMQDAYKAWKRDDRTPFVTTIHALNSAIMKVAKVQEIYNIDEHGRRRPRKVYKGIDKGVLPEQFRIPHEHTRVWGGIEGGFLSMSLDKDAARDFANEKEGGVTTILEADMHGYSGGADVEWCSQFPEEAEVLFASLTGVEVVGYKVDDGNAKTMLVRVRLNQNPIPMTNTEVKGENKKQHKHQCHELETEMYHLGFDDLKPLSDHMEQYLGKDEEWFNNHNSEAVEKLRVAKLEIYANCLLQKAELLTGGRTAAQSAARISLLDQRQQIAAEKLLQVETGLPLLLLCAPNEVVKYEFSYPSGACGIPRSTTGDDVKSLKQLRSNAEEVINRLGIEYEVSPAILCEWQNKKQTWNKRRADKGRALVSGAYGPNVKVGDTISIIAGQHEGKTGVVDGISDTRKTLYGSVVVDVDHVRSFFAPGSRVRTSNLLGKKELNGATGVVIKFDPEKQRYNVRLDTDSTGTKKKIPTVVSLKGRNLTVVFTIRTTSAAISE